MSRIVLGTGGLGALPDADLHRLFDAAFEAGVRTFETAPYHHDGRTEVRLGAWIRERGVRAEVLVVTKGAHPGPNGRSRLTPAGIAEDLERSRANLRVDQLDAFLLHRDDPNVPVEGLMDCLDEHVRAGRVRAIGVSNWTAGRIRAANDYAARAGRTPLTITSPQMSLAMPVKLPWPGCISYGGRQGAADRGASREGKLAVMAWSPLGSGAVAGTPPPSLAAYRERLGTAAHSYGTLDNFERLTRAFELGERRGASAAQIALAWLFHQGLDLFAIVATRRPEGIREAAQTVQIALSEDELAWLWDGTSREERAQRNLAPAVLRTRVWDAVIVGGGPTGVWTARVLTEAGMQVMLVDAGPERDVIEGDPSDAHTIAARLDPAATQSVQRRHSRWQGTPQLFVDDVQQPYVAPASHPFTWIRARQLGGRGLLWFGHALRMSDHELHAARLDGCEEPWPLSYAELAPFYERVERTLGVRGSTEGIAVLPDGSYLGPNPLAPANEVVKAVIEHQWPDRRVVPLRTIGYDRCDDNAKWWGSTLPVLDLARKSGRLDVRPDTVVRQVLVDPATGRARGVACVDRTTREELEIRGRVIVLAASAFESTRLLLASATSAHPEGLGGSSGCLGRYLVDHPSMTFSGRVRGSAPPLPTGQGTARAFVIPRFRNVHEVQMDFSRGYGVTGNMAPGGRNAPFHFNVCGELLPGRDNRMTLLNDRVDAWGVPVPQITCAYGENEHAMARDACQFVAEMGELLGLQFTTRSTAFAPPGMFVHEVGGARMGRDPRTSVLDPQHRVWDVDNLYVVDGAAWPSAGWQNPTLTLMALAVRAAEGIVARSRRGELSG